MRELLLSLLTSRSYGSLKAGSGVNRLEKERRAALLQRYGSEYVGLAAALVNALPPEIREAMTRFCLDHDEGARQDHAKVVLGYLREKSEIVDTLVNVGDVFSTPHRLVADAKGFLDRYFARLPAIASLSGRRESIVGAVVSYIDGLTDFGCDSVRVAQMQSGKDATAFEILERTKGRGVAVLIDCFDSEREDQGEARGSSGSRVKAGISFHEGGIMSLPCDGRYDLGILTGVFCGLPDPWCVHMLKRVRPYFTEGGLVVASNAMPAMQERDPLVAFILQELMKVTLFYKTEEELIAIFEEAGYGWRGCTYDEPHGFHCVGMGFTR